MHKLYKKKCESLLITTEIFFFSFGQWITTEIEEESFHRHDLVTHLPFIDLTMGVDGVGATGGFTTGGWGGGVFTWGGVGAFTGGG